MEMKVRYARHTVHIKEWKLYVDFYYYYSERTMSAFAASPNELNELFHVCVGLADVQFIYFSLCTHKVAV
jgi:hypothetical protein